MSKEFDGLLGALLDTLGDLRTTSTWDEYVLARGAVRDHVVALEIQRDEWRERAKALEADRDELLKHVVGIVLSAPGEG